MAQCTGSVVLDEASVPKRQAILSEGCSLFIQIGFAPELFTLKRIHEHGYSEEDFFVLIRPLHIITDLDELSHLTAPIPKNDFVKFVDHMKWLITDEGAQAISDSLTRLSKKNLRLTEQHVALAQKLVRYTANDRLTRKKILDEINQLSRRLIFRKKEYFAIDEDLKMKLGPLYEYEEPSTQELRIEAHKLYEDACRSEGRSAVPIYREKGFETAIREFGDVAKKRHLLRFLHDPNRQEKIEKYFKERLQWFDYVAAADPQGSGESSGKLVCDTVESSEASDLQDIGETASSFVPESVETVVSDEHVSKKVVISDKPQQLQDSKNSKVASDIHVSKGFSDKLQHSERKRELDDMSKKEVSDESQPKEALTNVSKEVSDKPHLQDSKRALSEKEHAATEQEEEMPIPKKRKKKTKKVKQEMQGFYS